MCFRFPSAVVLVIVIACTAARSQEALRVCADPDNLPYSNHALQGYENRIAALLAHDLHRKLVFHWSRIDRSFVREVLNRGECDVLIAIPRSFPAVLTTQSYFKSSYVFVARRSSKLRPTSFDDPVLKRSKIGIQILGEDYAPPAQALIRRGYVNNIVGFESSGREAGAIVRAVAQNKIDLAIVWGPLAGYFARKQKLPLTLAPTPAFDAPGIPFQYEMAMGVRKGNKQLCDQVSVFLVRRATEIHRILQNYGVPLVEQDHTIAFIARPHQ